MLAWTDGSAVYEENERIFCSQNTDSTVDQPESRKCHPNQNNVMEGTMETEFWLAL